MGCRSNTCRMASACFDMCVHNFLVKNLDVEEETCVDRCAFKYFKVHQEISGEMHQVKEMNELREQMANQQNEVMSPQ